jgi:alkanesulfonate monooxygenase SsuD/methylene tetrahydromethanopterin reductase-like flavin-dependent oxidoreductase (luciferase family)
MIEGQEGVTWEQWVALAGAAEAAGIEALFRSDHYLGIGRGTDSGGALDAWATLAGLAAVTERLRLGTLVSPVTFRPASVLAKSAVTVDHISGGRVELGIGAGWFEPEHSVYGFPFLTAGERVELLAEQLETILRQWTEDERTLPRAVQEPHPHLIGGSGKRGTVEPAVRWANEYNTTGASPEICRERREALDRACERAGRDPATLPLSLMRTCIVGSDEADLREHVARYLELYEPGSSVERFLSGLDEDALIGTADTVAERLARYERAGVTRVMLQHLVHEDLAMVDVIGRELAPAVA